MDQQAPVHTAEQIVPQQPDDSQKYVYVGLFIGALITVATIAFSYLKNPIESKNPIGVPMRTISVSQEATVPSLAPSMTPMPISTKQELAAQEANLDSTDMTSILKDLELNSSDSSQFEL